ncbi:uncharacterized protein F4822DRAFT_219409 [Hypoxylon trugodes]|uniref:uncharacterized protein n=1 Tax=Hypoxylon trugodes TaxID=326681 RepID=UPI00219B421D|nr:uncharacterized protein F4822DRAFT_219409 [Hypoxylon trugodes]KAI1389965.1 hypothetical protein F4822DRAFT_219409 [Hypoxylon trugodes]
MPPKKAGPLPQVASTRALRKRPPSSTAPQESETGESSRAPQPKRQKKNSETSEEDEPPNPKPARKPRSSAAKGTKGKGKGKASENSQPSAESPTEGSQGGDDAESSDENPDDDPSNGLDTSLAPISSPDDAFYDMVSKKLQILARADTFSLRVATMCSGTEAPIVALDMIREMFNRHMPEKEAFRFNHIFSAEIELFKQSYIARNCEGSILFKDVLDFVDPKDGKAPTAMGSMETIPGDIDLLISGCSCVDFSTLNTQKQKDFVTDVVETKNRLEKIAADGSYQADRDFEMVKELWDMTTEFIKDLGSSGQTFFGMMHYVRNYRPKIVILENVYGAPWAKVKNVWFPFVGYAAKHIALDTKNFYIPQTRKRGYLIALDLNVFGGELATIILNEWECLMTKDLPRRASTPISLWLLPPAHPLTERARQADSEKALNRLSKDADWERSKVRHVRFRKTKGIGNERPLTHWGQQGQPYDRLDRLMISSQSKRVLDCMEINQLRTMIIGRSMVGIYRRFDLKFKDVAFDLSQNIDRSADAPFGMAGCLTPSGIPFITGQCRLISGYETLRLQGLPVDRLEFATETQDQLRDLAGNAMSTTVVGAAMLGLFGAIQHASEFRGLKKFFTRAFENIAKTSIRPIANPQLKHVPDFSTAATSSLGNTSIMDLFRRCRRYCFCNGSAKYSTNDFLQCTVCSTIRCRWCARNPPHKFGSAKRPPNFLVLNEVEPMLMRYFPGRIVNPITPYGLFKPENTHCPVGTLFAHHSDLMCELLSTTFYYRGIHVTEAVTIRYVGRAGFELRAVMSDHGIDWYLYLDPWSDLGERFGAALEISRTKKGPAYKQLTQPIAKATVEQGAPRVLPDPESWVFWCFQPREYNVQIEVSNSALEITEVSTIPDGFAGESIWHSEWVCGKYDHQPLCDAPENSLHACKRNGMFLFKDVAKIEKPTKDGYVISDECRPLEPHEYREVYMMFTPNEDLRPRETESTKLARARTNGYWFKPDGSEADESSCYEKVACQIVESAKVPNSEKFTISKDEPEQHVLVEASTMRGRECDTFNVMRKYNSTDQNEWAVVEKSDLQHVYDFISHLNVVLTGTEGLGVEFELADIADSIKPVDVWKAGYDHREYCQNQLPRKRYIRASETKYIPHHHSEPMAAYERDFKSRTPTFEVRLQCSSVDNGMLAVRVRYLISPGFLGRKAAAYLPLTRHHCTDLTAHVQVQPNVVVSENIQIDIRGSDKHKFEPFRKCLKSLVKSECHTKRKEPGKVKLTDSQLRSLDWMLKRERQNQEFVEEEIEEEILSTLKLRAIARAQRKIYHHGGILADNVGYGKTVVTLALVLRQIEFDQQTMSQRESENPDCMALQATLVIAPDHLVAQWAKEANELFLVAKGEIVQITKLSDLEEVSSGWQKLRKLQNARLIIVSKKIFRDAYYMRLAKWAGSIDPPKLGAIDENPRHYGFSDWYNDAVPALQRHARKLRHLVEGNFSSEGVDELYREIEDRRKEQHASYESLKTDYEDCKKKVEDIQPKPVTTISAFKSPKELRVPESGNRYPHLLENFSYSRVIYDEFSYRGYPVPEFFAGLHAHAKWVLSATPPTKNLADVQYIADLLNVHVVRPVYERQGMPRITEGPKFKDITRAETLQIRKFMSDQSIRDRYEKTKNFLELFAISNPLDFELAGNIKVEEKVVVCEMSTNEFNLYKDMEQDMKACGFDAYALPKGSRKILHSSLGTKDWSNDGGVLALEALFSCSSWGNWNRRTHSTDDLVAERTNVLENAKAIFKFNAEKALWLAARIGGSGTENRPNAKLCRFDVCALLQDIWKKDLEACGGIDAWSEMWKTITGKEIKEYDDACEKCKAQNADFLSTEDEFEENFLEAVATDRSTTWHDYYVLEESDLDQMDEPEANSLIEDLKRFHGAKVEVLTGTIKNPKEKLRQLVIDETRGLASIPRAEIIRVLPDPNYGGPNFHNLKKAEYQSLCNGVGIAYKEADTKNVLVDRLERHRAGALDVSEYLWYNNFRMERPGRYPRFSTTTSARGGNFTYTGNDLSDTSLELRKAWDQVIYATKQLRIAEALVSRKEEGVCAGCKQSKPREELHFVCDCGHLLCAKHLDEKTCGETNHEEPSFCPAELEHNTVPLAKIKTAQRSLGGNYRQPASFPTTSISSKSQMIANVIKGTPEQEGVVLFAQYDNHIEELKHTLTANNIKFTTSANPLEFTDTKVRLLKLNSDESAGSNLQRIANHVVFSCPLSERLQQDWDAVMRQARGRCVRYGQKKTVHVYHFVTANTVEVDVLELRKQSHILVRPGEAIGRFVPAPLADAHMDMLQRNGVVQDTTASDVTDANGDTVMADASTAAAATTSTSNANQDVEERVNSTLTPRDIWKVMSEQNWLNTVGIEY